MIDPGGASTDPKGSTTNPSMSSFAMKRLSATRWFPVGTPLIDVGPASTSVAEVVVNRNGSPEGLNLPVKNISPAEAWPACKSGPDRLTTTPVCKSTSAMIVLFALPIRPTPLVDMSNAFAWSKALTPKNKGPFPRRFPINAADASDVSILYKELFVIPNILPSGSIAISVNLIPVFPMRTNSPVAEFQP